MTMNFKSIKAEKTTLTRDNHVLEVSGTGNLFETIVILSDRSKQLAVEMKEELNSKLEEFITPTDSLEEVFENREQIEISKFYERLPKPHSIAMAELGQDLLSFEEETQDSEPEEVED
jgi:DNA-directed RNA polymerase subunit K/omega